MQPLGMWLEHHSFSYLHYFMQSSATFIMDDYIILSHFTGEEAGARDLDNLLQVTHREQVWSLDFHQTA